MAESSISRSLPPAEGVSERDLASLLGVSFDLLKKARPQTLIWRVGRVIFWPRTAAHEYAASLGLTLTEKTPPPQETLTVHSRPEANGFHFAGNQLLIKARRASGEIVVVRTQNSSRYIPRLANGAPMTFAARKNDQGNWWVPVGKLPRFPGRW